MMSSSNSGNNETLEHSIGMTPPVVIGIALMLCAFWMFVWQGSLNGVFHFDDYSNIIENTGIATLWPLDGFLQSTRPIGLYSFALNHHFSGFDPLAYHVTNLVIHIINGLLLLNGCLLTWRLYRKYWHAEPEQPITVSALLLASLISTAWVVHPLTTQAVTNVVQRYESLASMGYLGVWVGMLFVLDGRRWLGCVIILPLAWIGLMSKEIFATAPITILLLDRLLSRDALRLIARKRWLPYTLLLSPYIWFIPNVLSFFDPTPSANGSIGMGLMMVSPWQYLRTQPEVIWHYLGLTVWPRQLCFDYGWPIQKDPWVYLPAGLSILLLIAMGAIGYGQGIGKKESFANGLVGWLILTFFFILAPTSSFMPIADLAFEHRMYLPCTVIVCLCVLAMRSVFMGVLATSQRRLFVQTGVACIILATVSSLAWRTHRRNLDYHNGLLLWQSTLEASPKNPRAWYNLGREHFQRGDRDAALQPMLRAVGYSNINVPVYDVGLADCLHHVGRTADAITLYQRAISKKPDYKEAYNSLGVVHLEQDRFDPSRECFLTAAKLGSTEATYNLGWLDLKQGDLRSAVQRFRQTLALNPNFHQAGRRLAWIHASSDDDAIRDVGLARALLDEHYDLPSTQVAAVWDTDGVILAAMGDFSGAIESTKIALTILNKASQANVSHIADLKERLATYQEGRHWIGGLQP